VNKNKGFVNNRFKLQILTDKTNIFAGFLDIPPHDALTILVSSIVGAGALFNSIKFGRRILSERTPKK
jgi:hypothetical protein